jgi:signal transduction histidine kinase
MDRVDAAELLDDVAARFRRRATDAGRGIATEAPPDLALHGDRVRLDQALAGLVDNALRHGAGDLSLRASRVDGHVELHVRDRGNGLPAGFAAHAFERFSRAAPTGNGAGLGLAIVAAIAGAHGGSAHASNPSEGGADIWLVVPAA